MDYHTAHARLKTCTSARQVFGTVCALSLVAAAIGWICVNPTSPPSASQAASASGFFLVVVLLILQVWNHMAPKCLTKPLSFRCKGRNILSFIRDEMSPARLMATT
eukprot:1129358-Amphidinium_carterae.1